MSHRRRSGLLGGAGAPGARGPVAPVRVRGSAYAGTPSSRWPVAPVVAPGSANAGARRSSGRVAL
jgi:hypothetical protein